ncbi:MAG TPA: SagB family peptide dehydrogenase, partial [Vicinamibacterales bacterium]
TYALSLSSNWTPAAEMRRRLRPYVGRSADRLLRSMVARHLLDRSDRKENPRARALETWGAWNPAASFFHLTTKNVRGPRDRRATERELRAEYAAHGAPPKTKRYARSRTIALPAPKRAGEFPEVLLGRRTWRKFSDAAVPLVDLATLLQLTLGVQRTEEAVGLGPVHLKTSPSSGARQPLEMYVLAVNVDGLQPGVYHYLPDTHGLELVKRGGNARTIARYVPDQPWYEDAAALVMFTAVFARTQWRYPFARAYRSVLLEAGHVCQTFCLVATWLGLAPFCTGRFYDDHVERDLRIDGISESFIYGAGVGRRPPGLDWAPWPVETGPDFEI